MATAPIPEERGLFGPLQLVDEEVKLETYLRWAEEYGEVYQFRIFALRCYVVAAPSVVKTVLTETTRFTKGTLKELKTIGGDGLFTTTDEELWRRQRRAIEPAFHFEVLSTLVPRVVQKANILASKWQWDAQCNGGVVDVSMDATKLTLDVLGSAGLGCEFNFLTDSRSERLLGDFLFLFAELQKRIRGPFLKYLPSRSNFRFARARRNLNRISDSVIREKRSAATSGGPAATTDIVSLFMRADPHMSDRQLRDEVNTMLLAGHETTANLLTWTFFLLHQHPTVREKIIAELQQVLGDRDVETVQDLNALHYLGNVLQEVMRLYPPIPLLARECAEDSVVGQYRIPRGAYVFVPISVLHKHGGLWKHPQIFDPDRFDRGEPLEPFAFIPFGGGPRACVGMNFALLEAKCALAVLLRRFHLTLVPNHQVVPVARLSLRPKYGLKMVVQPLSVSDRSSTGNNGGGGSGGQPSVTQPPSSAATAASATPAAVTPPVDLKPLLLLFGSQSGTCESFARKLAGDALQRGYSASVHDLEEYAFETDLASEALVIIVCSTYNGEPPQGAAPFYRWLQSEQRQPQSELEGLQYAVFGVGNSRWTLSYQRVPKTIDRRLALLGAQRMCNLGSGDTNENVVDDFARWCHGLWPSLRPAAVDASAPLPRTLTVPTTSGACCIKVVCGDASACASRCNAAQDELCFYESDSLTTQAAHGVDRLPLVMRTVLTSSDAPSTTMHLEFAEPCAEHAAKFQHAPGDHFGVYPENSAEVVQEFATHIGLDLHEEFAIEGGGSGQFPFPQPCTFGTALTRYFDLCSTPVSKVMLAALAPYASDSEESAVLAQMGTFSDQGDALYAQHITSSTRSVVEVLRSFQSLAAPVGVLLQHLPLMQPRLYSIASGSQDAVHLTVTVVPGGVCSQYLGRIPLHTPVASFVSQNRFPAQDGPVTMVATGAGIAPVRGLLADLQLGAEGTVSATTMSLFFGCRRSDWDYLYRQELESARNDGRLTELHVAFSRPRPLGDNGKSYVQHLLMKHSTVAWSTLSAPNGRLYVCGASRMANGVHQALLEILQARGVGDAQAFLERLRIERRYVRDVWD